jgi:hypothetical protein
MYKRWTANELDYIRRHGSSKPMDRLTKHLDRSEKAIWHKCKILGISRAAKQDGYTLSDVATGFHCRDAKVMDWVACGWLRCTRQGPNATNWNFTDSSLVRFVTNHHDQLSEKALQDIWVQGLLAASSENALQSKSERA